MACNWYIINVLSGYEKKVVSLIKEAAEKAGLSKFFGEFVVPVENVVEVKKGKKVPSEKKIFPGYMLVNMELNDVTWNLVKSVKYVGRFLGGGNVPQPVPEHEVLRVIKQVEEGVVVKEVAHNYRVGESIKIIDGVFDTFDGFVEEVDEEKSRLRVLVSIFGRETPVDLEFSQVEKR